MLIIAIDGPAGSGKSTIARALAERLGVGYLDTGAMYRAVTVAVTAAGIDPTDEAAVATLAQTLDLALEGPSVSVDGQDVTEAIRSDEITAAVSQIAKNAGVRQVLVQRQRDWVTAHGGGVLEGRDIGTVVFPDATLKVYLTARPEVRAARRAAEMNDADAAKVAVDIAKRDHVDSNRATSPLTKSADAVEIDSSDRDVAGIVAAIMEHLPTTAGTVDADHLSEHHKGTHHAVSDHELTVAPHRVEIGGDVTAPPTLLRRGLYLTVAGFLVGVAKVVFRMRIDGRENIPKDEPFILCPVHRSNIDFALVVSCTGATMPRLRFLAKDTLWKGALGKLWTALGAIPVHRGSADREALSACIDVLKAGEPLVMFPEGTRQSGPVVQELFDGPAYVQARTDLKIVPVGIGGSEAAMPKGAKFIRPRKLVLKIGAPIAAPERNERGRVPRHAIRAQTELLHQELQALFDDAQDAAGI